MWLWALFCCLSPQTVFSQKKVATADNPQLGYGILLFDQGAETNKLVSFQMPDVSSFETVYDLGYNYCSAGACVDGVYYLTSVSYATSAADRLMAVDMETKKMSVVGSFSGLPYKFADMTYDYSTNTMYGIVGSLATSASALYKIDLATAATTKVADLGNFYFTLACSYDGQLYVVDGSGNFCKINKNDGTCEIVGATGYRPSGNFSMEFNHSDKTLYMTLNTVNEESLLCTIDVSTGAAQQIGTLGSAQDAAIAGLYIPFSAAIDGAPNAVSDLKIVPDANGACSATISWTNPTTVFGGGELTDLKRVDIYRNGELVLSTENVKPGQPSSVTDVIDGETGVMADYRVVPVNGVGDGVETKMKLFVGEDVPATPTNITMEKITSNKVKVSWDAPTKGVQGGWIDLSTLRYKVVRQPDGKTLYESLTETSFTDEADDLESYTYEITPVTKAGDGGTATSDIIVLGPVNELPYLCDFTTTEQAESWSIVDADNNGRTWSMMEYTGGAMQYNGGIIDNPPVAADDWLISHDFYFEAGKQYKFTFQTKGTKSNKLQVCLGQGLTPEAMTTELFNQTLTPAYTYQEQSLVITVDKSGYYNIGFHIYSDGNSSFFYLTNIAIEQMAAINMRVVSLEGVRKPVVGSTYTYNVTVLNKGSQTVSDYTVNLKDAASGKILATKRVQEALENGAEKEVSLDWTPADQTVTSVVGEVVCTGDEVDNDNLSEPLAVEVLPLGSTDVLDIGKIDASKFSRNNLFNFYNKNSAALNIYTPEEIGRDGGLVEAFTFTVKNSHTYDVVDTPIKIYMANTDLTTANYQTGWIPESEMTLVYDGTVTLPQGQNEITIDLSHKFEFAKGKNLAVLTTHAMPEGYYNQVNFPYYDSADGSGTYYYASDYTPFDFTNYGSAAYSQKAAVTLSMYCLGTEISGKITDADGAPVEGATVAIESEKVMTQTDAEGCYSFGYMRDGEYTIKVSKDGYNDVEETVTVENGQAVTKDMTIEKINAYPVSGRVVSAYDKPLAGVTVTLKEGEHEYTAQTAEDGTFSWDKVITSADHYTMNLSKEWYKSAVQDVKVENDAVALGDVKMDYLVYAPSAVSIDADDSNNVTITWQTADKKAELRKDDGKVAANIGIENAVDRTVIGTIYREPMQLTSVKWFLTAAGGPHYAVNVFVFDLDENGEPTNKILKSVDLTTTTDEQWSSCEFDEPVNAPRGCLVALGYYGYLGVGVDAGSDLSYPFAEHTHVFSGDYAGGDFDYIEDSGYRKNLMIRAEGYRLADNDSTYYAHEEGSYPDLCKYKVWRYREDQKDDKDSWTLLNDGAETTGETTFVNNMEGVGSGVYGFAVSSVYPDGSESERVMSPLYAHDMKTRITVPVTTNSKSGSAEGATVSIKGKTYGKTATAMVSADGTAVFEDMLKDQYDGTISLSGYENMTFSGDFSTDNEYTTQAYELKEIIVEPFNLTIEDVEGDNSSALFTWNTSGTLFDDFESHDDFAIASPGEIGWNYWDLDQQATYGFTGADFPGMGGAMSFMVFNPSATTPAVNTVETLQPHSGSKYLASFAAESQNNDWIISPVLNYAHDFSLSFYARSYAVDAGYPDYFSVGYTDVEDPEPDDFVWLAENVGPSSQWDEYSYTIPASAKHVAIRNVSTSDGFILMIDDIYIGSLPRMKTAKEKSAQAKDNTPTVEYEVYLDGNKVGTTSGNSYLFENLAEGEHEAGVKAVYNSGESAIVTIKFGEVSGIEDVKATNKLSIYPNPAKTLVHIEGNYDHFVISSINGARVLESEKETTVNVSGLEPGVYIVTAYDETNHVVGNSKLIVAK